MFIMYVDESGDCGLPADGSPTRYFCLTGLVVHELRWHETLLDLLQFRYFIKSRFKVYLEEELHASAMINKPSKTSPSFQQLKKYQRLQILRLFTDRISKLLDISLINIVVDKHKTKAPDKDEVFRWAWYSLLQRFENTIRYQNFPGPKNTDDKGIVISDNTDGGKLQNFLRTMRIRNPLTVNPSIRSSAVMNSPIRAIIEDPILRDSRESYFIQAVDCAAYLLKQSLEPCGFMKKHGGNAYFKRLEPVLCKKACLKDPLGIVRL